MESPTIYYNTDIRWICIGAKDFNVGLLGIWISLSILCIFFLKLVGRVLLVGGG